MDLGDDHRVAHDARVELELLHVALDLANKDHPKARDSARRALLLAPDLKVDLSRFWPSLAAFLEQVRSAQGRPLVTVSLDPPSAQLWVNGRSVASPFEVAPGRQIIEAEATGYRRVRLERDIAANTDLKAALPLALPSPLRSDLADGTALESSESLWIRLDELRETIGVARLAVAFADQGHIWAVLVEGPKKPIQSAQFSHANVAGLAQWIATTRESAAKPRPPSIRSAPPKSAARVSLWLASLEASTLYRSDALSWSGTVVEVERAGVALSLAIERTPPPTKSGWVASSRASIELVSFSAVSQQNLVSDDLSAGGGIRGRGEIRAGYAVALGKKVQLASHAWLAAETLRLGDVSSADMRLGVLEDHSRISAGVSLDVNAAIRRAIIVNARIHLGFFNSFSGDSALAGRELVSDGSIRLQLTKWQSGVWGIGAAVRLELATLEFSSAGMSTAEPVPNNATRDQFGLSLGVLIVRRL